MAARRRTALCCPTRRRKKPLTLRELESAAGLRLAVFLALDRAAVAGQEAGRLDRAAQRGLEAGQRLRDAVQHRTRLARQAAALDGRDDVVAADPVGQAERLVDDETQRRTREIDFLVAAVDRDLARPGLQPHAGDGVLAAAGRIGAALLVDLLFAQRRGRGFGSLDANGDVGEILEIGHGLFVSHYAPTLFLRFIEATSSTSGYCASCGGSGPATMRMWRIC